MADLATGLLHVAQADQHIAQARDLIASIVEHAQARKRQGSRPQRAGESLATMTETLDAFEGHSASILQAIADIRAETRRSTLTPPSGEGSG